MDAELTVLLVEDDPGDQVLIMALLEAAAGTTYVVRTVDRLTGAMDELRRGDIDVVLLDLSLPDAQGLDSFRTLRSFSGTVPVVVLTGLVDQDVALEAVTMGAQDYLVKGTVDPDALTRAIRYAVERNRHLHRLALVDELTGAGNRRGFALAADHQWHAASAQRTALSVIVVDLDGMKAINDGHGHAAGDQALVETAAILRSAVREVDVVARVGGDEFHVLLTAVTDGGRAVITRVQAAVEARNATAEHGFLLQLSVGAASLDHDAPETIPDLVEAADQAMYAVKSQRRGVAVVS